MSADADAGQDFTHDDITNRYYLDGAGDGVPIVLLPGGSLKATYLAPLARQLARAGHRVARVDARQPPTDPDQTVTMHDLAADVAAVMDHLDLPTCWVAGHAFGNRVARAVALDHPDRIEGVILLAAGGVVPPVDEAQEALRTAFSDAPEAQMEQAMTFMVGDPADAGSAWQAIKVARAGRLGPMQSTASTITPEDEWATLVPGKPTMIIQGSKDQIAPPANGEKLAE
ncbi:MAG: alpha/beta fold hydrolase, partial [Propioniciclava sp.]